MEGRTIRGGESEPGMIAFLSVFGHIDLTGGTVTPFYCRTQVSRRGYPSSAASAPARPRVAILSHCPNGVPHWAQNLAWSGLPVPQLGQTALPAAWPRLLADDRIKITPTVNNAANSIVTTSVNRTHIAPTSQWTSDCRNHTTPSHAGHLETMPQFRIGPVGGIGWTWATRKCRAGCSERGVQVDVDESVVDAGRVAVYFGGRCGAGALACGDVERPIVPGAGDHAAVELAGRQVAVGVGAGVVDHTDRPIVGQPEDSQFAPLKFHKRAPANRASVKFDELSKSHCGHWTVGGPLGQGYLLKGGHWTGDWGFRRWDYRAIRR